MWLRNYKLTEWMVKKMLKSQGGKCAICRKDLGEDVCVDHNHISQAVRGILCTKCNCRLGAGWDDPNWAIAAAVYLKIIPKPVDSGTTGA